MREGAGEDEVLFLFLGACSWLRFAILVFIYVETGS